MARPYEIIVAPPTSTWQCDQCHEEFLGGIRIEMAIVCCIPCLRQLVAASPEDLIEDRHEIARKADGAATLLDQVAHFESWWNIWSRRKLRKEAKELRAYRTHVHAPGYYEKVAAEHDDFRAILAHVESVHGADAHPLTTALERPVAIGQTRRVGFFSRKKRGYRAAFRVEKYRAAAEQLRVDNPELYQTILSQADGSAAEESARRNPDAYVALFLAEAEDAGVT